MEIYTTFTLSQVQTILALILSVMGLGWFFFLTNAVKFRASKFLKNNHNVPIVEAIVPTTVTGVFEVIKTLRIKWITPVVVINMMIVLGLMLTSFEGIIVVNTVHYVESCGTTIVKTHAQIINEAQSEAASAQAEVEAMMNKRSKSGVPSGVLIGQIPDDNRWKYDARHDVDPYPWRSSCSLYKSGVTQVKMNTSILLATNNNFNEALPEVHAKFIFGNSPDGYNFTLFINKLFGYPNSTSIAPSPIEYQYNGFLFLRIEEFIQGGKGANFSKIGMKYANRLWTLRVPETNILPFKINKIISVPIVVKAYTCEMERVKEGSHGSYNIKNNSFVEFIQTPGRLIGRKYIKAVIGGKDTSIYELTPEHWASYLAVKDTQTEQVEEVFARMSQPCITVDPAYILLICAYSLMFVIGIYLVIIRDRTIPNSTIEWVRHACKESTNTKHGLLCYNLGVTSDDALKIKLAKNSDVKNKDEMELG